MLGAWYTHVSPRLSHCSHCGRCFEQRMCRFLQFSHDVGASTAPPASWSEVAGDDEVDEEEVCGGGVADMAPRA